MSDTIVINTESQSFGIRPSFKCSGYGLADLIKDIKNPVALEIGCDIGDTAEFLLSSHTGLKLYSVDPYQNYVDWNGNNLNERSSVYETAKKRLEQFGERHTMLLKYSDDAVQDFSDIRFDLIFVDGLHTYEQCLKDCINYYPLLKDGCVFSGHDYTAIQGVNRAAKEFAAKVNKNILTTECDVWYWYK